MKRVYLRNCVSIATTHYEICDEVTIWNDSFVSLVTGWTSSQSSAFYHSGGKDLLVPVDSLIKCFIRLLTHGYLTSQHYFLVDRYLRLVTGWSYSKRLEFLKLVFPKEKLYAQELRALIDGGHL